MTILGGRSRRALRGVTLVVDHQDAWTTEWIVKQVLEGVRQAQGSSCPVDTLILSNEDISQEIQIPSESYLLVPADGKMWIPQVFTTLQKADAVIVTGIEANKTFAKNLKTNLLYLPILVDRLDISPHFLPGHSEELKQIAQIATTMFFNSEMARSTAESVAPSMCERTKVINPGAFKSKKKSNLGESVPSLFQSTVSLTPAVINFLEKLQKDYRELITPPRTVVTGTEREEQLFLSGEYGDIRFLPGVEFHSNRQDVLDVGTAITIVDDVSFDNRLIEWNIEESLQLGAIPLALSLIDTASLIRVLTGRTPLSGNDWGVPVPRSHGTSLDKAIARVLGPHELSKTKITNVILAGSDFKFASALVRELDAASDINFVVDRVENNSTVSRTRSTKLAEWADVVITEFLNEQSVWYSHNLSKNKRLIVHMHGFELYGPFADRINLDGVHQIVVPSEGYKAKVIELRGWPNNKLKVIQNSGSLDDLVRPKARLAQFTLGLVGWVPSLKRIDRALDVLERLIEIDDRYALEVRGAPPWDYTWEWNTPAHRDTYIEILRRLKTNPKLAKHITFSPFSPDVGNWLQGIGWMLSPSSRESFHLAPVEGMLSGAVPIVWQREGAVEIFGTRWVVDDTEAAVQRIISTNIKPGGWEKLSQRAANDSAERYSETISRALWHEIIVNDENHQASERTGSTDEGVTPPVIRSVVLAGQGDFLAAWEEIQRTGNLALDVSRGYGLVHSAWVQGHIRLVSKLLMLQHKSRQQRIDKPNTNETHISVQIASLGRETPRELYGAASVVLLKPPAGSPESEKYIPSYFSNFEPFVPILGPDSSASLSLEEYLEDVAKQLVNEAKKAEAYTFRVDGPYWAVLAALIAAIEVGGRVDWDLSVHTKANYRNFRPNTKVVTDDPLELSSIVISELVRRVLVKGDGEYPRGLQEMFDVQTVMSVESARIPVPSIELSSSGSSDTIAELPKISIILPSYRSDSSVLRTLDSIFQQTYPLAKLEVQIVLNGPGRNNISAIRRYMVDHSGPDWQILESASGVAAARNKGLAEARGDYLTFIDDDDAVEQNYIAALVAMSDAGTVVAADMIDVDQNGNYDLDTNAVRCVKALGLEHVPAYASAGLFGASGGKLIPRQLIGQHRFIVDLSSGEDVAFLGSIVAREGVRLVAAHRMSHAAYIRTVSRNSVSRPDEVSLRFAIDDRLRVAHAIWEVIQDSTNAQLVKSLEDTLIRPQISLMLTALDTNPGFRNHITLVLQAYNDAFIHYLNHKFKISQTTTE